MQWSEIRQAYPNRWLIVEPLEAHTTPDRRRHLDCLAIIETCPDGAITLQNIALSINNTLYGSSTLYIPATRNSIFANVNG
jgi:hypothetical protein